MKDVSGAAANPEGNRDFSNPMYEAMGGPDFGASNASSRYQSYETFFNLKEDK
jgi:hypothetical protein